MPGSGRHLRSGRAIGTALTAQQRGELLLRPVIRMSSAPPTYTTPVCRLGIRQQIGTLFCSSSFTLQQRAGPVADEANLAHTHISSGPPRAIRGCRKGQSAGSTS